MKKPQLSLSLGLVCMLFSSLLVLPNRANAGRVVNQGSSVDSSSSSGGSFGARNNRSPSGPINQLFSSQEVQEHLNEIAKKLTTSASPNTPNSILATLLMRGTDSCVAATQLQTAFENLGASPASVKALINALSTLYISPSSSTACLPVGSLSPVQSVVGNKELTKGAAIAQNSEMPQTQNSETPYVSIAQLDAAIKAYNKIVLESSPETLQKLAQDPQFLETGKLLKEFRAAIKAWDESRRK